MSGKQTQWLDYLQSPILALTATPSFCAAAMQDGSLNVYSHTGRKCVHCDIVAARRSLTIYSRIMPPLSIGSQCYALSSSKYMLMLLTVSGMLYVWYALSIFFTFDVSM